MQCTVPRRNGLGSNRRCPALDIKAPPILHAMLRAARRVQGRSPVVCMRRERGAASRAISSHRQGSMHRHIVILSPFELFGTTEV
eukprot:11190626-Lingulodinium_polyedra.AAC.1